MSQKKQYILGISAFYHDSAAVLIESNEIIAAAQEERFSRLKQDPSFPVKSIEFCLSKAGIDVSDLTSFVFYDKPFLTFDRLLESFISYAPKGYLSFLKNMPIWLKEKLMLKSLLKKELSSISGLPLKSLPPLLFTEHHQSHAASAYFPSPFDSAAVLCLDGVGEWATTSVWHGQGNKLSPLWQIDFPHSLGLLYSAFTYFCGFKVNSGEYKLMGLAPYGEPIYQSVIEDKLIKIHEDGTFTLNMDYFDYVVGSSMINSRFSQLFSGRPRQPETEITQREKDLAASVQAVTEKIVLLLARKIKQETQEKNLCLAGGVALNCVANGKLASSGLFENIWVQPASGDAGGALGAALAARYTYYGASREISKGDQMKGAYLGDSFNKERIEQVLMKENAVYDVVDDDNELLRETASMLSQGKVVGWYQGRMEFGPRALGNRSILADPRDENMQSHVNLKIKFRESFRPFAPVILERKVDEYFEYHNSDNNIVSPYMLFVAYLKEKFIKSKTQSMFPAITHIDFSARIQTVSEASNAELYGLLTKFNELTGCPMLINTSFNIRGEPIVNSPYDAWCCFMHTNMDALVIGAFIIKKEKQLEVNNTLFSPKKLILD